ncbi:MAG: hypothetical protein DWQ37_19585 [Planctomycetota bacterium]|nr:MAG: hypothetical protein DWQ37_19585 [Planctomycetota bacterium]
MNQAELQKRRQRLLDDRRRLESEVQQIDQARAEHLQPPGEISNVRTHPADQDAEGLAEQVVAVETLRGEMRSIDDALARIGDGSYGICKRCGKHIASERLEAIPHAGLCVRCEQAEEDR